MDGCWFFQRKKLRDISSNGLSIPMRLVLSALFYRLEN